MAPSFPHRLRQSCFLILIGTLVPFLESCAKLKLPAIFGENMVLQRGQADPIWGWDAPGRLITVSIAGQSKTAIADATGKWVVKLDPLPASSAPLSMTVQGSDTVEIKNILVGEVWLCSGQSNMIFKLCDRDRQPAYGGAMNAEVEAAGMRHPEIRLLTVPFVASQEPQNDFAASWTPCTPESAAEFSAVGLFFGRYLHDALGVPVGLICNACGGSDAETWMNRKVLENDPMFAPIIHRARRSEAKAVNPQALTDYQADLVQYEADLAKWKVESEKQPHANPPRPEGPPRDPREYLTGYKRPGNLYNGMLNPVIGYGIKGALWYQGESNTRLGWEYRRLFPALITEWRRAWGQGDFPFYWAQLPNHGARPPEDEASTWAELRESQTLTMKLPHTGQAVTIDIGEASTLHPRDKLDVAARLARWAMANEYGISLAYRSPEYQGMSVTDNKATITFAYPGSGLTNGGVYEVTGFTICGEDHQWKAANAAITAPDKVEVWSDAVKKPVAIRYAWADNPDCNLRSWDGLAVTPFRTDNFKLSTQPDDEGP